METKAPPAAKTAASPDKAAPVKPRHKPQILAGDVAQEAGYLWAVLGAEAKHDHTLEDVLDPGYFWHAHERIRRGCEIVVKHELGFFRVHLDVVGVDHETKSILTQPISILDYTKTEQRLAHYNDAVVEKTDRADGVERWHVRQGKFIIMKDFTSRTEADRWLRQKRVMATDEAA